MIPTFLAALWLSASALFGAPLAGKRPNVIFILTDDQGYGDFSAHGNPVLKTPHLDRLRQEGGRFSDFQVSPTCSPVLSYVRQSFGNDGDLISAEAVRRVRGATKDRANFYMVEELLREHPMPAKAPASANPEPGISTMDSRV